MHVSPTYTVTSGKVFRPFIVAMLILPLALGNLQAQWYVDPLKGNDRNSGTIDAPFQTLVKARDVVRTHNSLARHQLVVYLRGGIYPIHDPIEFTQLDGGKNDFPVVYQAYNHEKPVFEAGKKLSLNWKQASNGIWVAENIQADNFRQLYINGKRADRARSSTTYTGSGWPRPNTSFTTDNWLLEKQTYPDGIQVVKSAINPDWKNPQDIELIWIGEESHCTWRSHRLLVSQLVKAAQGDSIVVKLDNYGYVLTGASSSRPLPESPFYIENALELLDSPGEWYFDRQAHTLYYMPRTGEDIRTAEVYIPGAVETILRIQGASLANKVKQITFKGIVFAHTNWMRPSSSRLGACSIQADKYINGHGQIGRAHKAVHRKESFFDPAFDFVVDEQGEAEGFKPRACVELNAAESIQFVDCEFRHLGAVGVDLTQGCNNIVIRGNTFDDLSATAIVIGRWDQDYVGPNEEVCKNVRITNNYIHQIGQEYYNSPGITAFFSDNLLIAHNEIADIPYSGISSGWGAWKGKTSWTTSNRRNVIEYNFIHDFSKKCSDGGGIYTIGIGKARTDPDSLTSKIRFNYIRDTGLSYGALYPDEGSCYYEFTGNVLENVEATPKGKWLHLWSPLHHNITVKGNFSNSEKMINKGILCPLTSQTTYRGDNRPRGALDIIKKAGRQTPARASSANEL